jgi:uncharacterized protein DUF4149
MQASVAKASGIRSVAGPSRGLGIVSLIFLQMLTLVIWLGGMLLFAFAVAPSAFAVLPTRELAGALVTSVLSKVELLGLAAGPLLMVIVLLSWKVDRARTANKIIRLLLLTMMSTSAALSRFLITPTMVSLRESMGGLIDQVPADDPMRIQFDYLHQYSVGLMSVAIFAGLIVLFLTVSSWSRR